MGDPVRFGLVASMARPGGNVTGVSVNPGMEFYDKRYQLLKEAVPKIAKLGVLISRVFVEKTADGAAMRGAAQRAGIELILPTIEAPYWREEEYRAAFARMAEEGIDGVVVGTMVENWIYRRLIIALDFSIAGAATQARHYASYAGECHHRTVAALICFKS
jgi:ABC transporter substrate binding protein